MIMNPPSVEEFGEEFVNNYRISLENAKKENREQMNNIRKILSENGDYQVPSVDSGYSFFCKLNPNENINRLAQEAGKSVSEYYKDRVFQKEQILINSGEGKIVIKIEFGSRGKDENYINIYANLNYVSSGTFSSIKL
jgi:hypothetical protein